MKNIKLLRYAIASEKVKYVAFVEVSLKIAYEKLK